ncbi:tyrosine-type recombinase/integrase [Escherichia coli]|uniref:tyrosine-type recombinase/integrase n=1 Tax=Escherichia coli TaxID=562 RepID=UPI00388F83F6
MLCTDLPRLQEIGRPRPSRRLPVVLTPDEVVRILGFLEGEHRLFAQLLYGTGMRISEGLQLRVKDLDFRSRHDHRAGGQGLQGSGLDVTRELGTQPARAAVACTGMVAEGPGRGPQRRCASRRP